MDVYLACNSSLLFLLKAEKRSFLIVHMIILKMLVLTTWVGNLKIREEITEVVWREITNVEFTDHNGLTEFIVATRLTLSFIFLR